MDCHILKKYETIIYLLTVFRPACSKLLDCSVLNHCGVYRMEPAKLETSYLEIINALKNGDNDWGKPIGIHRSLDHSKCPQLNKPEGAIEIVCNKGSFK